MGFEQATIPIENKREFEQLRGAIDRVFTPPVAEKFLGDLKRKGINIRQFDRILADGTIDRNDAAVGSAGQLYAALTMTDQAQLREFYLERLEKVPVELRQKFSSIYRTF